LVNNASKNTKPVAVWYGGTFDPPHRGHQQIVHHLLTLPQIDTVLITPAWLNPFKETSLASAEQRLKWARHVFVDPRIELDAGEVNAGHRVYTADTIRRLGATHDIRYIAIGSDNLIDLEAWHDFDWLNQHLIWLVFARPGYDQGYGKLRDFQRIALNAPISSTQIRRKQDMKYVDGKIIDDVQKTLSKGKQ